MKMLILNDFAKDLGDVCLENILFSTVPKAYVYWVTVHVKQTDKIPESLCSVYSWISKSINVEDFLANLFVNTSKEIISKIELLAKGQNNTKLWWNYRKGVITV